MYSITIKEIKECTKGKLLKSISSNEITNISTDSREINDDALFIPIIGESLDGHNFLESAYQNGYRSFLIDSTHTFDKDNINLIEVKDTTKALGDIAAFYKQRFNIPFIGVTGSVGKTSTKDMIESVLKEKYKTFKTEGNHNNEIGLPKTIFDLTKETEVCILEMGMSFKGEIEHLANIVHPNIAVISNIGMSHIEHFDNQDGIFEAKMEITKNFNKDNLLIVNGDDKYLKNLKTLKLKYRVLSYGFEKYNDIYCDNFIVNSSNINFTCNIYENLYNFTIPTIAKHNILNAMAAILIGLELDLSIDQIKKGLANFEITKGRLTTINKENYTIIDDTYNASADSMISALNVLENYKTRKVAILGDILETGAFAEKLHREVGKNISGKVDVLILVGKDVKYIKDEAIKNGFQNPVYHFDTYEEVIKSINSIINKKDTVLIKASHGIGLSHVVEFLENYED